MSKNDPTPEQLSIQELSPDDYQRALNDYREYVGSSVEAIFAPGFSRGIIDEVDMETLKKYFSNPDEHQKAIEDLAQYYYTTSSEVHQLFELVESLPTLNYKLDTFDKSKSFDSHVGKINKSLYKIKHKKLTRDILKQEITAGTLIGIWLGNENPYPLIFDNLRYVFPAYRSNGEWVVNIDMNYFAEMKDEDREIQLNNLSPHVTVAQYQKFKDDPTNNKYVSLPQDRTFVLRTHTLKRNQNLGNSWVTTGLYDVQHKKKLKDVERSIANKIINAVAVLTVGSDKNNGDYSNLKLPSPIKRKIHGGVKAALEKKEKDGVTVVTIPDFASIEFPDVKADGLDGKKFEHVNNDIKAAYGLSGSTMTGDGGNFSSSTINLDYLYRRIGILLEDVEQEVYGKFINIILPKGQKDNYFLVYDKQAPLTQKEKMDYLVKLNDKGWSTKHLVDNIDGINWEQYLEQTLYETDVLELQSKIQPYQSSSTMSNKGEAGRPVVTEPASEGTEKTKTNGGL